MYVYKPRRGMKRGEESKVRSACVCVCVRVCGCLLPIGKVK